MSSLLYFTLSGYSGTAGGWHHGKVNVEAPDLVIDRLIAATGADITGLELLPANPGQTVPLPAALPDGLRAALAAAGVTSLYRHQRDAVAALIRGESVLLTTGTASGKSLAFQLPALGRQLADPASTMLTLYPTKALAHDQAQAFGRLAHAAGLAPGSVASYDGDTPASQRQAIRASARTLLTNPDMLHSAILPHHTLWRRFLSGLSFIAIDEIHTYRGVFGSHLASVIRRLLRLTRHYGAQPVFILTSATLGNPLDHARQLTGAEVMHISQDTAPHAERRTLIVQPPIVDADIGIRRPPLQQAMSITRQLVDAGKQVLLFGGTRQATEEAALGLREDIPLVRPYRSGLLPRERREIEQQLRTGEARAVVTTNALELGVDIGSVDAVVIAGYPGSAAAFRQQAGRAGRRDAAGLAVLVLGGGPLDQYLAAHPEYLFGAPSERALSNPDHLLIALDHLRCAAFELPVRTHETWGSLGSDDVALLLGQLQEEGQIHAAADRYYWLGQRYPAADISLRTAGHEPVTLVSGGSTIGTVDGDSAHWLVHAGAVYLHDGQPYLVGSFDPAARTATMEPTDDRYLTRATRETVIEAAGELSFQEETGARRFLGDVLVNDRVTGYRRLLRLTHETIGRHPLESEPVTLFTSAYGFSPHADVIEVLRTAGAWSNDANDYGASWPAARRAALERDGHRCQVCGTSRASGTILHVHHKAPFRTFGSATQANDLSNLVTLCPSCHHRAEQGVRVRSGLAATAHVLRSLAPLLVMCDSRDLGIHADPASSLVEGAPALVIFETVPGGIGLTDELARNHTRLLNAARDLIAACPCSDGCPACVGPAGEPGHAGKAEALALLGALT